MPRIHVRANVGERDLASALAQIVDYERWAQESEAVKSVRIEHDGDGGSTSFWEVVFGRGLMKWSERDRLDLAAGVATFDLIEGDPYVFRGTWTAEREGADCVLTMSAEFDLGMPSLSHTLDPMAIEAVEDAASSVLRGLFGDEVEIDYGGAPGAAETTQGAQP